MGIFGQRGTGRSEDNFEIVGLTERSIGYTPEEVSKSRVTVNQSPFLSFQSIDPGVTKAQ